jgi:hypothetical protein
VLGDFLCVWVLLLHKGEREGVGIGLDIRGANACPADIAILFTELNQFGGFNRSFNGLIFHKA